MILGRHPALWIGGVIQPVLFFFVTLGTLGELQSAAILGVLVLVGDLLVMGLTRDTVLGAIVGIVKALLVALSAFSLNFDPVIEGAALGLFTALVAFFQMNATSPIAKFSLQPQRDQVAV